MKWFKIDGKEYSVKVFEPKESFTILYSDNTGRTLDEGAPMVLDPLGTFFNYTLTVGKIKGSEEDFENLWEYISFPRNEALQVVLPRGRKKLWETTDDSGNQVEGFYAYVSSGKRGIKKIVEDVEGNLQDVEYEAFSINFIAMKAQVLPSE